MRICLRNPFNHRLIFRMNTIMMKRIVLSVVCVFALSACEATKETVGLNRATPDEFKVVKRAPLVLPPDYVLRPPQPGAPRPQEQAASQDAAQAIFGSAPTGTDTAPTSGENALLNRAGSSVADPDIRRLVDNETAELFDRNKPVAEKLLGIGGSRTESSATVVNAKAEAERLKANAQDGKPVTEGETPSIEE